MTPMTTQLSANGWIEIPEVFREADALMPLPKSGSSMCCGAAQ